MAVLIQAAAAIAVAAAVAAGIAEILTIVVLVYWDSTCRSTRCWCELGPASSVYNSTCTTVVHYIAHAHISTTSTVHKVQGYSTSYTFQATAFLTIVYT
jgi:hypothetical protein